MKLYQAIARRETRQAQYRQAVLSENAKTSLSRSGICGTRMWREPEEKGLPLPGRAERQRYRAGATSLSDSVAAGR